MEAIRGGGGGRGGGGIRGDSWRRFVVVRSIRDGGVIRGGGRFVVVRGIVPWSIRVFGKTAK